MRSFQVGSDPTCVLGVQLSGKIWPALHRLQFVLFSLFPAQPCPSSQGLPLNCTTALVRCTKMPKLQLAHRSHPASLVAGSVIVMLMVMTGRWYTGAAPIIRFPAAYGFDQLCGTAVWEMALEASELCSKEMQLIVLKSLLQIVRPHHPILIYVANCAAVVFLVQRYISAASTLCNKFRLKGREDVSSSPNNNTL